MGALQRCKTVGNNHFLGSRQPPLCAYQRSRSRSQSSSAGEIAIETVRAATAERRRLPVQQHKHWGARARIGRAVRALRRLAGGLLSHTSRARGARLRTLEAVVVQHPELAGPDREAPHAGNKRSTHCRESHHAFQASSSDFSSPLPLLPSLSPSPSRFLTASSLNIFCWPLVC